MLKWTQINRKLNFVSSSKQRTLTSHKELMEHSIICFSRARARASTSEWNGGERFLIKRLIWWCDHCNDTQRNCWSWLSRMNFTSRRSDKPSRLGWRMTPTTMISSWNTRRCWEENLLHINSNNNLDDIHEIVMVKRWESLCLTFFPETKREISRRR